MIDKNFFYYNKAYIKQKFQLCNIFYIKMLSRYPLSIKRNSKAEEHIFRKKYKKLKPFLQKPTIKYDKLQPRIQESKTFVYYSDEFCILFYFLQF